MQYSIFWQGLIDPEETRLDDRALEEIAILIQFNYLKEEL